MPRSGSDGRTRRTTPANPDGARFLLYSHDGVGLGHFRRNLILAEALTASSPTASVLLACAVEGMETFSLPGGVDVLRLPGLRKAENGRYVGRQLNLKTERIRDLRASLMASAVEHYRPHVLLADKHPLGLDGELLPALRAQKASGALAALGLRDVLDDPARTRDDWLAGGLGEQVRDLYELVLIYGSAGLLSPLRSDMLVGDTESRIRYCGYVASEPPADRVPDDLPPADGTRRVLATVGGGEDGATLLEAFIEAARGAPWRGLVVAGPQMPAVQWSRIRSTARRAGLVALQTVPRIERWYRHVDALVCMGGYNTLVEAASAATPTVCVPRTHPREEQLIRARAFAAEGLLELVEPGELAAGSLRAAIERALATPREALAARTRATLELDGAARAAAHLLALATHEARTVTAPPVLVGA